MLNRLFRTKGITQLDHLQLTLKSEEFARLNNHLHNRGMFQKKRPDSKENVNVKRNFMRPDKESVRQLRLPWILEVSSKLGKETETI